MGFLKRGAVLASLNSQFEVIYPAILQVYQIYSFYIKIRTVLQVQLQSV